MGTVFIEGSIMGHASPKWKNPGKKNKKVLNKKLSIERAEEVDMFVKSIFERKMADQGMNVEFAMECTNDHNFDSISLSADGLGDTVTLEEAGGDQTANEDAMRRTDINMAVTHQMEGEAGMTMLIEIPEECTDQATDKWAIKIGLGGGAGHVGVGGAFALGKLKNRKTGQVVSGSFVGGGIGVGLQTPGADPGWGDWTNFTTDQKVTFQHFDGTLARLTTAGIGLFIGYTLAYISFPWYGANSISVGGLNLGSLGADAGSNVGKWDITSDIPGPPCILAHTIPSEETVPYTYDVQNSLKHSVFFETGSSRMSDGELTALEDFVQQIVDQFNLVDI